MKYDLLDKVRYMVLWLHFPDLTTLCRGKSQTYLLHPLNPVLFYM